MLDLKVVAWLKKKQQNRDVVEAIFTPMIKVSKDRDGLVNRIKWPPSMKLKVLA